MGIDLSESCFFTQNVTHFLKNPTLPIFTPAAFTLHVVHLVELIFLLLFLDCMSLLTFCLHLVQTLFYSFTVHLASPQQIFFPALHTLHGGLVSYIKQFYKLHFACIFRILILLIMHFSGTYLAKSFSWYSLKLHMPCTFRNHASAIYTLHVSCTLQNHSSASFTFNVP